MYYVHARKNTNEIGHELLQEFGTLEKVFSATEEELIRINGIGEQGAVLLSLIGQLVNRVYHKSISKGVYLKTQDVTFEYCMDYFKGLDIEKLILISMNSDKRVLSVDVIREGDHSASVVDIRKILRLALKNKATCVILAHNHPGDTPNPSDSDIIVTGRIIDVLEGIEISVCDHIICGENYCVSLEQRGFMSIPRSR